MLTSVCAKAPEIGLRNPKPSELKMLPSQVQVRVGSIAGGLNEAYQEKPAVQAGNSCRAL